MEERKNKQQQLIPKILVEFEDFTFFDQDLKSIVKSSEVSTKTDNGEQYTIVINTKTNPPRKFTYKNKQVRDANHQSLLETITQSVLISMASTKTQGDEEE